MANSPQAKKRARQAEVHRARNAGQRSMFRTYVKNVVKAIEAGNKSGAEEALKIAVPVIDRIADKNCQQHRQGGATGTGAGAAGLAKNCV